MLNASEVSIVKESVKSKAPGIKRGTLFAVIYTLSAIILALITIFL